MMARAKTTERNLQTAGTEEIRVLCWSQTTKLQRCYGYDSMRALADAKALSLFFMFSFLLQTSYVTTSS
jgi:hypothetical protein